LINLPYVEKQKNGEYLIVSQRDKIRHATRTGSGGPRRTFMVIYTYGQYKKVNGRTKQYPYPGINIGNLHIRCPDNLAGKRVRIRLEIVKLPGEDVKWKKGKKLKKKN
jgi:hypothetical protein